MEVRIGVQHVAREITFETELSPADVTKAIDAALAGATLDLTDSKGRRVVVPAGALGYVEVGPADKRKVGFTS